MPEVCTVTSLPRGTAVLELFRENYDVADSFHPETWHPQKISVLLVSDVYWKIATNRIDRFSGDLKAVETNFGWTIQGTMELPGSLPTRALFLQCSTTSLPDCDASVMRRFEVKGVKSSIDGMDKARPKFESSEEGITGAIRCR